MYCYLEFKLSYLKNLKLYSIRVKELSEPIVLWRKAEGLALFIRIFSRNRSSDATWFYGKKRQNWEGKSVFNWKSIKLKQNVLCFKNHNCICHICAKEFLDSNFNEVVIDKISNFHEILPNFHIFTGVVIFQVYLNFVRPTASSL